MAFLERGLSLLSPRGVLGVICPNRFTRNRYGTKIRAMITEHFRLLHAIDLSQTSPFTPEVMAYPGIYIVGRGATTQVNFFHMTQATPDECREVTDAIARGNESVQNGVRYHRYEEWFSGEKPWVTESPAHLDLVRRLEDRFATLGSPESGTHVGIGVATGADNVFIVPPDFDEVERDLLLPLAMTGDCVTGALLWGGAHIINPFASEKGNDLINLNRFPLARQYFLKHEARLRGRNVGKRNPNTWYRTIDRIYPSLVGRPKLLIPDIKAEGIIAYDPGKCYPHHNLYYITADYWDLQALQTILRSSLSRFFIWMYGVRMRSNFLRFQAQYLRRIPIPAPLAMTRRTISHLAALADEKSSARIDAEVQRIYNLTDVDMRLIRSAINQKEDGISDETT